jgi:hypothetical protein
LFNLDNGFSDTENEKAGKNTGFSLMAPLIELEQIQKPHAIPHAIPHAK